MINIFNNRSKKELKLLKEILGIVKELKENGKVKELEAQMDSWLGTLRQSLGKLKAVSDKVDSTK